MTERFAKQKLDGIKKVAGWKLLLRQHIGGNTSFFFFQMWGEDKRIGCSQDKGGRVSPRHILNQQGVEKSGWIMSADKFGC